MNTPFTEKVILITGGTSGIGRATAIGFAECGATSLSRAGAKPKELNWLRSFKKQVETGCLGAMTVNIESEIAALVARALEHFGRLDFAFNNAGVDGEGRGTITATEEIYDQIMNINVRSVFFCMKNQIPAILQSGGGAIVNNASILGLRPRAGSPIYSASKAAVIALTKSVALEFAPKGLRVNAVCAAIIETDMSGKLRSDEETRRALLELHPVGRFGTSEEVAAAVLYLCSPEAPFLTGVALPIDGGWGL